MKEKEKDQRNVATSDDYRISSNSISLGEIAASINQMIKNDW